MIKVFLDTSYLKAFIDPKDDFHAQALLVRERLRNEKVTLITSNFVFDESFTLINIRCGRQYVIALKNALTDEIIKVVRVISPDEKNAWKWFLLDWSKLSFTDCVSFALMKRLGLNRVATFDTHFERAGFEIEK